MIRVYGWDPEEGVPVNDPDTFPPADANGVVLHMLVSCRGRSERVTELREVVELLRPKLELDCLRRWASYLNVVDLLESALAERYTPRT